MEITLQKKMKELLAERHNKINKRAKQLIAEEMLLRDLRKTLELSQANLSSKFKRAKE